MATAEHHARPVRRPEDRLRTLTIAVVLTVMSAGLAALIYDETAPEPRPRQLDAVDVTSSTRHAFASLEDLVAVSDLVVSAEVIAAEPGRVFAGNGSEPSATNGAVRSRVLTLHVDGVLHQALGGAAPSPDAILLVEEEGWLLDDSPITVDGVAPSEVGDSGIWFLIATADPELPGFVVVNSQGRYLSIGERVDGGDRSDPLVRELEALGPLGLVNAITTLADATSR
jgi:hypothetical protein